jgi:hypothetical protein
MRRVFLLTVVVLLIGRTNTAIDQSAGPFTIHSSNQGTFLLNIKTGKVWLFDPAEEAFLEVPVKGINVTQR